MISEQSRDSGEVSAGWKLVQFSRDNPGNHRAVSPTSVPGKTLEKIILGSIEKPQVDSTDMGHSQHSIRRGKSCLATLVSCYISTTHLDDPGKPGDGICSLQQSASRTGWGTAVGRDLGVLEPGGTPLSWGHWGQQQGRGKSCSAQASQGMGTAQGHLDNALRARGGLLGCPGQGQELDSIPVDPSTPSSWESITKKTTKV